MGESSSGNDRGTKVSPHPKWVELIKERLGPKPWRYERLAGELNVQVGEEDAFSKGTVERALRDNKWTDEILDALSKKVGLDYPIVAAAHPEELKWLELGRTLRVLDPTEFQLAVEDLTPIAAAATAKAKRRQRHSGAE